MKKIILLLILIACSTQIEPQQTQTLPIAPQPPESIEQTQPTHEDINDVIINKLVPPFTQISTDTIQDNFGIIKVQRYDARYNTPTRIAQVHIFKFNTQEELQLVLDTEFYDIIDKATTKYNYNLIAIYLAQNDHMIALWPNQNNLVYIETYDPYQASKEIIDEYLKKYPSQLKTNKCIDTDGQDYYTKGTVTKVKIGTTITDWTDTCIRDFAPYKNKQYKSVKGITEKDGLLEGRCTDNQHEPGYIIEYPCARGCQDGTCNLK